MTPSRWRLQLFRLFSLVVPPLFAVDSTKGGGAFDEAWKLALVPLWLLVLLTLFFRAAAALAAGDGRAGRLDRIDVLTSSGCATAWLGSAAIWVATWFGWASLSVLGVMALAVLYLAVLWTCIRAGGGDPWRRASFSRSFLPESAVEGDAVREEVTFARPRIPAGFRLLAAGRVGARWPLVRYALESVDSRGEVVLASEVGPALRGEHEAEPFDVWLEDVLGLCHSVHVGAGAAAKLRVLPKPLTVTDVRPFFARDGHDVDPRPRRRLPTEGAMHLREYAPGDDARRIHWVRSLAAGEIVVRLPDEVPRDRPSIELALDTFFPGAADFACDGPAELLDAMVRVWLGLGRALRDQGARVTMVVAAGAGGEKITRTSERLVGQSIRAALTLGARAAWQGELGVRGILEETHSLVVSCKPMWESLEDQRIILLEPRVWAPFKGSPPFATSRLIPFPAGTPENRRSTRQLRGRARAAAVRDHETFLALAAGGRIEHGEFVFARLVGPNTVRLTAPPPLAGSRRSPESEARS